MEGIKAQTNPESLAKLLTQPQANEYGNIFLYVQDIKAISFYSKSQQKNDSLYAKGFSDQTMRFPEREGLYVHYEVCLKKKLQEKCTYPAK